MVSPVPAGQTAWLCPSLCHDSQVTVTVTAVISFCFRAGGFSIWWFSSVHLSSLRTSAFQRVCTNLLSYLSCRRVVSLPMFLPGLDHFFKLFHFCQICWHGVIFCHLNIYFPGQQRIIDPLGLLSYGFWAIDLEELFIYDSY